MENVRRTLQKLLGTCHSTFEEYRSGISKIIPFRESTELIEGTISIFRKAVKSLENTPEFQAFAEALGSEVLGKDLDRLTRQEKKRREKRQKKDEKSGKQRDYGTIDKWRSREVSLAARSFLRNTGAYLSLWKGIDVDVSSLIAILQMQIDGKESEYIRLLVFDGVALYDDIKTGNRIFKVSLPIGEIRVYQEEDLHKLFRLPQTTWHYNLSSQLGEQLASLPILTVQEKEPYRGRLPRAFTGEIIELLGGFEFGGREKEADIEMIGPIFLCLGDAANLAEEIRVRTNVFDELPVSRITRNGYLPPDESKVDEDGNLSKTLRVIYIGKDGFILRNIYRAWSEVNGLTDRGLLKLSTQNYARAVMNWHYQEYDRYVQMGVFVNLVTVLESLLVVESRSTELSYKTALRGAALLASDFEGRSKAFEKLRRFYKVRSNIVHEGHFGEESLDRIININLLEIVREMFLRYIALITLSLRNEIQGWGLPNADRLASKSKLRDTISALLDAAVMEPSLVSRVEDELEQWGWSKRSRWWLEY